MNICDNNIFQKILHFYSTLKNGWSKHDFFVLMNALEGVHERAKNLLTRIGIRDSPFCDEFFGTFFTKTVKSLFLKMKNCKNNH